MLETERAEQKAGGGENGRVCDGRWGRQKGAVEKIKMPLKAVVESILKGLAHFVDR
jgi:hypothetical protein